MTVTLIISDVHANPWALDAVFNDASRFSFDDIWFLGDLLGYGPGPYRVWNKLFNHPPCPVLSLAGNHDWGVIGRIEGSRRLGDTHIGHYRRDAFRVIECHQDRLKKKNQVLDNLRALPVMMYPKTGVYLVHGEWADNPEESVKLYTDHPTTPTPKELAANFWKAHQKHPSLVVFSENHHESPPRIFASGHTHLQRLWRWDATYAEWHTELIEKVCVFGDLEKAPIMFNPGSVGFPRDPSGRPAYAIIDWELQQLSFHQVWYDTAPLHEAMSVEPYDKLISDPQFFIEPRPQENV